MFTYLVRIILRNRLFNLIFVILATIFIGYMALDVRLSYDFAQMLPASDSTNIYYKEFKKTFGEDGAVMFIAIQEPHIYDLKKFNAWYDLTNDVREIEGVEETVSVTKIYHLLKNDSIRKFEFEPIVKHRPTSQAEVDSLKQVIYSYPFYKGLLYNRETGVTLLMVTLDKHKLNTKGRVNLINKIQVMTQEFSAETGIDVHYSGLPYIRTKTSEKIQKELISFTLLAMLISFIILLLFFRSFQVALYTMVIVIFNVIWAFGLMSVFDYEITLLTGIIPPLIIVIVVENCIFLLNKYVNEYRLHGNKVKALSRVVQRIGPANLLTNATTAAGFAAFTITGNKILVEFGITASISILLAYLLTLFLIPIILSNLRPPRTKHMRHLEKGIAKRQIERVVSHVQRHRKIIYIITIIVFGIGLTGSFRLKTTGNIVDDISKKDELYKDLMFLEKHFNGVMPLEISIDTRKKRGVMKLNNLKKIDALQDVLKSYPELSKPVSLAEVVKFSRQAFYGGDMKYYGMPNSQELNFMARYLPKMESGKRTIINSFVDTNLQVTRISTQMKNIGTTEIHRIKEELRPRIDSIFSPSRYDVEIPGTSVVFLKGTEYLVKNLTASLLLAIAVIAMLMALMFTSPRMIFISLIPNVIPLVMTAGMMGFFGIPIKPSTILIFSIALGISVDNAIHFLSRYRLYLRLHAWQIKSAVISALRETGFSMIYSSIVLFCGFAIFTTSSFGGTEAMGYLISFTLVMALLSNLFVLPSLILTLDKRITTKTFKEPLLDILDEEVDIELEDLEIEKLAGDKET